LCAQKCPTSQVDSSIIHEIQKQICFERANIVAGYGKIGLDYKLFGKLLDMSGLVRAYQCVCKIRLDKNK